VATRPKRRHHSLTVVSGRPSATAIRRTPAPAALRSRASPMTSTLSQRYGVTNQGSRAAVLPQRRQRTRGTKMRWSSASRRWRRYPDQGPVAPPQRGQAGRGGATSRPSAAYVLTSSRQGHTITDGGPSLHHDPPRARYPRGVTWFVSAQIIPRCATRCRRPHSARPSPAGSCPYRHAANTRGRGAPSSRSSPRPRAGSTSGTLAGSTPPAVTSRRPSSRPPTISAYRQPPRPPETQSPGSQAPIVSSGQPE